MSDTACNQSHSGTGDNVAGNKNEINLQTYVKVVATTPENLKEPVETILEEINNRNFDEANTIINVIESMGALESEVKDLLTILKIKCRHTANEAFEINLRQIKTISRTSKNEMLKDLAFSIIMTIELKRIGLKETKELYEQSTVVGPYSRAVALSSILDEKELKDSLTNQIHNISEEEITGLIHGLIRTDCLDEAIRAASYLNDYNDNYHSKFILFYTKAIKLNKDLLDKDYWCLKQSEKEEVDDLITETLNILSKKTKKDARLFNIIFPSFNFTKHFNKDLFEACKENIELVGNFLPDYADELRIICNAGEISDEHPTKILKKALADDGFKKTKTQEILDSKEIEFGDFWIARNLIPQEQLQDWIKNGVVIKGDFNELEHKLNRLSLLLISDEKNKIKCAIANIIEDISKIAPKINSEYIKKTCEDLCNHGYNQYACDVLIKYLSNFDGVWCSPLVEYAIYSLFEAARYKDLLNLLEKVNEKDKSINIAKITIWTNLHHGSPHHALDEIKKSHKNNDLDFTFLKLQTLRKLGKLIEAEETLQEIACHLFREAAPVTLEIIKEAIKIGAFNIFEETIAHWFIDSPEKNYYYISQACLELMTSDNVQQFKPTYNVCGLESAVQYHDGDKSIIKLISSDEKISSNYILSPSSIIAKGFSQINIGEFVKSGAKKLTLENKHPPFIAIKSLSMKIRDESNDGSDSFQVLSISEDPTVMLEQLRQAIPQNKLDDTLFTNDIIPLSIRMNLINRSDPIKASMLLLFNKKTKFKGLINNGQIIKDSASTDIITIMYLCLTSLSEYFIKSNIRLHLLEEDIKLISDWLDLVENNKFLMISKDENGNVIFFTSENVKRFHGDLIKNLKEIMPLLQPLPVILDNYDRKLTENADIYSQSYIKSFYAIKNSNYPFFSIDSQNLIYFYHIFSIAPANSYKLLLKAASSVSFSKREQGVLLHAMSTFPYPLLPQDLVSLADSYSDLDGLALSMLLNKYKGTYNDDLKLDYLLASIFSEYYYKSIFSYTTLYEFKNHGLNYHSNPCGPKVDRIFNLCCSCIINQESYLPGQSREAKIVNFLIALETFHWLDKQAISNIMVLASNFVHGHFLSFKEIKRIGAKVKNKVKI